MSIVIVIVIIAALGYFISLRIHPLTRCRECNGGGRHYGSVYTYAQRRCRKCGGTGRKDRLGVKLFGGGSGS